MSSVSRMEVVNLVGIQFVDGGKSVELELIPGAPPHETTYLTFKNAFVVALHRSLDDGFPFVLVDLEWRLVESSEMDAILSEVNYPFFGSDGRQLLAGARLISAQMEGDIVGSVLSEGVIVENGDERMKRRRLT